MKTDTLIQRTQGEWVAGIYMNEASIYCPSKKVGIAKMPYSSFPYSEQEVQENVTYICKAVNNHEALLSALKKVYSDIELQNVEGGSNELNFIVQEAIEKAEQSI